MTSLSDIRPSLPLLTPKVIALLRQSGVVSLIQFLSTSPERLSSLLGLPYTSIIEVRAALLHQHAPTHTTALDLYQTALANTPHPLATGSTPLDTLLGGEGLEGGVIYEVFGGPGSGKTQLCISVAALCALGGGTVAYIDTRGDLCPERLKEVMQGKCEQEQTREAEVETALEKVKVARCPGHKELFSYLEQAKTLEPKLLVIDNLTSPVMPLLTQDNLRQAFSIGSRAVQEIRQFATPLTEGVSPPAVLVTSNLRAGRDGEPGPALAKLWLGLADVRILLVQESGGVSQARLVRGSKAKLKEQCKVIIGKSGLS